MDSNKYVDYLLSHMEEQRWNLWKEKLSVARLQQEVARNKSDGTMREKLVHELEEERHLRFESEKRLQEMTLESERHRVQMCGLQQQFSRMEETVRNLLQSQGLSEPNGEESVPILKSYQETLMQEGKQCKTGVEDICMSDKHSRSENSSSEEERDKSKLLLERLKALEAENSALAMENKNQREQYERCLDEVANQVVQALLTQKNLREECLKLKTRVFDLEQQNQTLNVLFQQRVKPTSSILFQECQQNMKSGIPALKCQNQLNGFGPHQVYPRSSCSSSELSLSSACSEYSSSSSWNDGKACKKKSVSWDKRISIGSSFPSNHSSPADDLPPTRIKENHILDGLKKLQKQKTTLEPPSVVSKWGYKDCMDSNEGIYSPGIKYGTHKEQANSRPETEAVCLDHQKIFVYDSDSHEDVDDDSSSLALLHELPRKDCRHYYNKLTHSVSDSLFGWEPDRRHLSEISSYFNSKEKPEKLTSFVNGFQLGSKSCRDMKLPVLQIDKSHSSVSWRDLNLHLSDTDDNEILDELHIESSDEKSPPYLSLAPSAEKNTESCGVLGEKGNTQLASSEKQAPPSDIRTKACNFIKQQKIIKKTSSEECITVIFDAEDGKPIEFNSHQAGIVTVTRNEISIHQPDDAENTTCLSQGVSNLQNAIDAKSCHVMQMPVNKAERKTAPSDFKDDCASVPTPHIRDCPIHFRKPLCQNTSQQKLTKPGCSISSNLSSPSCIQEGNNQKHKLTKVSSRDRFLPQTAKVVMAENFPLVSSHCFKTLDKGPLSPAKWLRRQKMANPNQNSKVGLNNCKMLAHPETKNLLSESTALPQHLLEPVHSEEKPTRDVHCDGPPVEARSPSPPLPTDRSASLLIRPHYEHSPPVLDQPGAGFLSDTRKDVQLSPQKGKSVPVCHNVAVYETKTAKLPTTPPVESNHFQDKGEGKCISEKSPATSQVVSKIFSKKIGPPSSNLPMFYSNQELYNSRVVPTAFAPQDISSLPQETGVPQKPKFPESFCTSLEHHISTVGEQSVLPQINPSPVPLLFQGRDDGSLSDKVLKPHLSVGLKLFITSPRFVRKSSTVPGKQEKDCMNAASKCSVNSDKQRQGDSSPQTTIDSADPEEWSPEPQIKGSFSKKLKMDPAFPISSETCNLIETDRFENKSVKRSLSSSNKAYLKPALGMTGAKARSQSFSIYTEEILHAPSPERLGKVRTQIITNTSERGNSLTRQNSAVEGLQMKFVSESAGTAEVAPAVPCTRQGMCAKATGSNSQMSNPSKLPFRTSPKGDLCTSVLKKGIHKSASQSEVPKTSGQDEKSSDISKRQSAVEKSVTQTEINQTSVSSDQIFPFQKNVDRIERHHKAEGSKTALQEMCLNGPETSGKASVSTSSHPTIEEKVMLCIQENMQKGQGQNTSGPEMKQKNGGPSLASWFGFRKSKLPALNSRKIDTSKVKVEKKEAKGSAFGSKQAKSEKRKDKKKSEQHCEAENELNRKTSVLLEGAPKGKKLTKAVHPNPNQTRSEQKNSPTATYSGKDNFMKELLHRVDKKAAQQTESGSKNVSYRSVSKSLSQGSPLPSNSINTQRNQKKNSKTKVDIEIPNKTLVKVVRENFQEDAEDNLPDSRNQSHLIESCCQMRTLDSGIGTFPLPDSGNRSTGRHVSKQGLDLENEDFTSPEQPFPQSPSEKAQTLEREVPSTTNKSPGSVESVISHSASDPTMADRGVRALQSHLPKAASSGVTGPVGKNSQESSCLASASLDDSEKEKNSNVKMFPDWSSKNVIKAKDRALRVCTYSASSSSDTEMELEHETNDFGTGGEMLVDLMKSNKQAIIWEKLLSYNQKQVSLDKGGLESGLPHLQVTNLNYYFVLLTTGEIEAT
ncbi:nck-associated protein 5 isoform X4 [Crotalus tigris]|nr:nck-associated protein 5 isoform X4 [Crotalus tigris]XP_039184165.1 nck-associated protein 5 isoform X4 [Crotalus tigris]XP_039184166.1 nck-associated protein 5 isoform X4 [Crotalus tigris]XP_039184167.1 nck-associated protein 5 isoform X4 [Crotalus tigris]XP_039184168.1 nck-associated protein 5 isoform X4 [Crotalus tigris]